MGGTEGVGDRKRQGLLENVLGQGVIVESRISSVPRRRGIRSEPGRNMKNAGNKERWNLRLKTSEQNEGSTLTPVELPLRTD